MSTKTMIVYGADNVATALENLKPGQQVLLAGTVVQGRSGVGIRVCIVSNQVTVRAKCPAGSTVAVSRTPVVPPPPAPVRRPVPPQSGRPQRPQGRSGSANPPYRKPYVGSVRYVPMGE